MVKILDQTECCVCYFTELFAMSQSAISQHMQRLKKFGLINEEPRRQWIMYTLNIESIYYPFVKSIIDHMPDDVFDMNEINSYLEGLSC